jgi:hypothetical protein
MKVLGWVYVILGLLISFIGVVSMASDIQVIIVICGANMVGLGLVMRK